MSHTWRIFGLITLSTNVRASVSTFKACSTHFMSSLNLNINRNFDYTCMKAGVIIWNHRIYYLGHIFEYLSYSHTYISLKCNGWARKPPLTKAIKSWNCRFGLRDRTDSKMPAANFLWKWSFLVQWKRWQMKSLMLVELFPTWNILPPPFSHPKTHHFKLRSIIKSFFSGFLWLRWDLESDSIDWIISFALIMIFSL